MCRCMCVCVVEGLLERRGGARGPRQGWSVAEGRLEREGAAEAIGPVMPVGSQGGCGKAEAWEVGQEASGLWFQDSSN